MKSPSILTLKKLFAMSGNVCAMPGCEEALFTPSGDFIAEVCHINGRSKKGPRFNPEQSDEERNGFENLLILCPKCHKIVDSNIDSYPAEALSEIKKVHESYLGRSENDDDILKAQKILQSTYIIGGSGYNNFAINSPGATQTNNVYHIKTGKKVPPSIEPPHDSIGSDRLLRAYISHLIERYNQFASKDKTRKTKFSFGAVSNNIKTRMGADWKLLNINDANEVISYLHGRIDKTIVGKVNNAKGIKNYSSFSEWAASHPNLQ